VRLNVPTAEDRPTLTVREAAAALGCSGAALYRAVAANTAPVDAIRIGERRIVISTSSLRRVLGLDPAPNGAPPAPH
jgi:predicted DNA-binding transcriptional regulator AlpA